MPVHLVTVGQKKTDFALNISFNLKVSAFTVVPLNNGLLFLYSIFLCCVEADCQPNLYLNQLPGNGPQMPSCL